MGKHSHFAPRRTVGFLVALITAIGLGFAGAGPATAEAAGKYDYQCTLTSGYSYMLPDRARLDSCKGAFLTKYIGGRKVSTVMLNSEGKVATASAKDIGCLIVRFADFYLVFTPAGLVKKVIATAVTGGVFFCRA